MTSSTSGALNAPFSGLGCSQPEGVGCSQSPKLWDVFINHRGPDVKETLALQLYKSLENLGIRAFLDREELERGDDFPLTIQNAIRFALVQIAIFSKGYADSPWCLAELDLMLQSNKTIIPIFYGVKSAQLRRLETGPYAKSFSKYEDKGRYTEKLSKWKENLNRVSFIYGYEFGHNDSDLEKLCEEDVSAVCKRVVSAVQKELQKTTPLEVAKHPVGITEILQDFEITCWQETERTHKIIGIYGLGGSGKTTLATSFFNRIRSEYSESSFLFNVREAFKNGNLTGLQSKLLNDLVHETRKFDSIPEGSNYLGSRLGRGPDLRFLICIDDIDDPEQLDALVGWDIGDNATSSLIIVTSRDERVLIRAGISARYRMKEMNVSHSTELFCWNAFHQKYPSRGYEKLVKSFVEECGGLPLSVQVLGGLVFDSAGPNKSYWEMVIGKVKKTLPQEIEKKLRISFDALDDEQKQIFMDIACFFVHRSSHLATRIWAGSGWSAEHTLQTLIDKCLVEIYMGSDRWMGLDSGSIPLLRMHDHVRDLGRKVANQMNSPRRLWNPAHLRSQQEKGFRNILAESARDSFRCLNSIFEFRYFLGNSIDFDDQSTSLLWLELDLSLMETMVEAENREENTNSVPSLCTIPPWIPLQNLQCFKMSNGRLERLFEGLVPFNLKDLVLDGMILEEFPDSLGMLSHLEVLVVRGRAEWTGTEWDYPMQIDGKDFSNSLTELTNLKTLVLRDLALSGGLTLNNSRESTVSLQDIYIRDVKLASKVIISAEYLHSLKSVHLESMENLIEVSLELGATLNYPDSATYTESDTEKYSEAEELSSSACQNCLERVIIDGCWALQKIGGIENLEGLKCLQISANTPFLSSCTDTWQKLPSQVASLIWNPAIRTWIDMELNIPTRPYLTWYNGEDGTITRIPPRPINEIVLPVTVHPSAIIIAMLFLQDGNGNQKVLKMPLLDGMVSHVASGSNVVVVVVTDEEKISKMLRGVFDWLPMPTNGILDDGCIITINEIEKLKVFWSVVKDHLKYMMDEIERVNL